MHVAEETMVIRQVVGQPGRWNFQQFSALPIYFLEGWGMFCALDLLIMIEEIYTANICLQTSFINSI